MKSNKLVGKKVLSVSFTDYEMTFKTESGDVKIFAHGDCCSYSYIESIDDPSVFEDAVVLSISSEDGGEKEIEDYDVHRWTFYKFKTTKGMCTVSMRNESNGYYDGHLSFSEDRYSYGNHIESEE